MKREKIWALVILVLIGLSAWVMLGTHYSKAAHGRVATFPTRYGLDIRGGVRAVLQAQTNHLPAGVEWNPDTAARVRTTLENRINASGVGDATVQPKGSDQYIVELPDVKNKNAILEQLGTTASMTFYYFHDVVSERSPNAPITMNVARNAQGHEVYSFFDKRSGQVFRDGAQVKADFTRLLGEGTGPRTGATEFTVPNPLASAETVTPPDLLDPRSAEARPGAQSGVHGVEGDCARCAQPVHHPERRGHPAAESGTAGRSARLGTRGDAGVHTQWCPRDG